MTNLFFSLLIRFLNSAYLAWVDFWSQVRGQDVRALRLRRLLHSSYKRSNLSTRGDRISGSRPTSPSWTFSKGSQCCSAHWNAFELPCRPQVYLERTLLQAKVKIGKKTERRHCTLPRPPCGMHSNYRTSRYPLLKTMVAVHKYPGSFSENILNVKR